MVQKDNFYENLNFVDDSEMYEESEDIPESSLAFAEEMLEFFADIIRDESLLENFATNSKLANHFKSHCQAGDLNKTSKRQCVYYDFDSVKQYQNHEQRIKKLVSGTSAIDISSLYETEEVIKGFHKLFEGSTTLVFTPLCGFVSTDGKAVSVVFHSFANKYTLNYEAGNTIDYLMYESGHTKTLFPLDANYLENKFNNLVVKWNKKYNKPFAINR